jgi:hypothetical protein
MCLTFQTRHRSRDTGEELPGRGRSEAFVDLGDVTEIAVRGPHGPRWAGMTFGLRERDGGRVTLSNARLDHLDVGERWCMLGRQLCAVPIHGWRWNRGSEWVRSHAGWALGFHEQADGFVLVADASSGVSRPVVVTWNDVTAWMAADAWDHRPMLRAFAERRARAAA